MRIVVYGTGYVGLVTGTGLAEIGHEVLCVDIDPAKIESLKEGKIPIYEPGLGDLVKRNERSGRLTFTTKVTEPYDTADFYFIAVGTPPSADGSADISAVLAVGEEIARTAKRKAIVVVKSTVPVGTCDEVQKRIDAPSNVGPPHAWLGTIVTSLERSSRELYTSMRIGRSTWFRAISRTTFGSSASTRTPFTDST